MSRYLLVCVLVAVLGAMAGAGQTAAPVGTDAGNWVRIDGDMLVWETGAWPPDIYARDMGEPLQQVICNAPDIQTRPDTAGGWVVWTDRRSGTYAIYGRDPNGVDVRIRDDQQIPAAYGAIGGDLVVWQENRGTDNGWDLYGWNTAREQPVTVCAAAGDQLQVATDGRTVVWADRRNGGFDIYGYDLATGAEFEVCRDAVAKTNPAVSGQTVLWQEPATGGTNLYAATVTNMVAGEKFPVSTAAGDQKLPRIDGPLVVWEDHRGTTAAIYARWLDGGGEFALWPAAADQAAPAVSGRRIAWVQGGQVWLTELPEPAGLTVLAPNRGETWLAGADVLVEWATEGEVPAVDLAYSTDGGGNWTPLVGALANTGAWSWDTAGVDSNRCLVRVSETNGSAKDTSDGEFTIFACDTALTADLTADCLVDVRDLAIFTTQWLTAGNPYDPAWRP